MAQNLSEVFALEMFLHFLLGLADRKRLFPAPAPAQRSRAESMPKAAALQIAQPIWTQGDREIVLSAFFLMSQKDPCESAHQYRATVREPSDVASNSRCHLQELLFIPWIFSEVPDLSLRLRTILLTYQRCPGVHGDKMDNKSAEV